MRDLKHYHRPKTATEAATIKREYGARAVYLGGGSDLLVHRPAGVEAVIDIRRAGMSYIRSEGDYFAIGGGALLRDVERDLGSLAGGMFGTAVRETAPWLIRNAATLAGNVANASPAADGIPALLALDTQLLLLHSQQTVIPLAEVLTGPHRTTLGDSLVEEIRIPRSSETRVGAFIKLARSKSDIALVNIAVSFAMDGDTLRDVRVALGAVAPTAMRASTVESVLEGRRPTHDVLQEAAERVTQDVRPITDFRATEAYRRRMCGVLLRRAVTMAINGKDA